MKLERVKAGVRSIVGKLRPGKDQLSISSFNSRCTSVTKPGDSFDAMIQAADAIVAEGQTILYDAIVQSMKDVKTRSAAALGRRHGLIVLTDGSDVGSNASLEEAKAVLTEPGIANFFCVLMLVNVDEKCKQLMNSLADNCTHMKIEEITTEQGTSITNTFAQVSERVSKSQLKCYDPSIGIQRRTRRHSFVTTRTASRKSSNKS